MVANQVSTRRREHRPTGSLRPLDVLLVLGVGLSVFASRSSGALVASGDGLHYVVPWAEWLNGRGFTLWSEVQLVMPPGYGLLSLPWIKAWGDPVLAGVLTTLLSYLATLWLTASIAERVRPGTGPIVGVLLAVAPIFVVTADGLLSEPTFTAVLAAMASIGLASLRRGPDTARMILLGALGGLLYLIRPEGAVAAFAMPLSVALTVQEIPRGQRARKIALAWLVSALIAAPYLLFLHRQLGYWSVSGKSAIVRTVGAGPEHAASLRESRPELFDPRRNRHENPASQAELGAMVRRIPQNTALALWALTVNLWPAVAACTLVALFLWQRPRLALPRSHLPLFLAWGSPILASLPLFVYPRFVLPYLPVAMVGLAALAISPESGLRLENGPRRYIAAGIGLFTVTLLCARIAVPSPVAQPNSLQHALELQIPAADVQAGGALFREIAGCAEIERTLFAGRDRATFAYSACGVETWPKLVVVAPDHSLENLARRAREAELSWVVKITRQRSGEPSPVELSQAGLTVRAQAVNGTIGIYSVEPLN